MSSYQGGYYPNAQYPQPQGPTSPPPWTGPSQPVTQPRYQPPSYAQGAAPPAPEYGQPAPSFQTGQRSPYYYPQAPTTTQSSYTQPAPYGQPQPQWTPSGGPGWPQTAPTQPVGYPTFAPQTQTPQPAPPQRAAPPPVAGYAHTQPQTQTYGQTPPQQPYYYPTQLPTQYSQYPPGQGQLPPQTWAIPGQYQQTFQPSQPPTQKWEYQLRPRAATIGAEPGNTTAQVGRRQTWPEAVYDLPQLDDLSQNFSDLNFTYPPSAIKSGSPSSQWKSKGEIPEQIGAKSNDVGKLLQEMRKVKTELQEMELVATEKRRMREEQQNSRLSPHLDLQTNHLGTLQKGASEEDTARKMTWIRAKTVEEIEKKAKQVRFAKEEDARGVKEEAETTAPHEAALLEERHKEAKLNDRARVEEEAVAIKDFADVPPASIKRDDFKYADNPPSRSRETISLVTLNGNDIYGEGAGSKGPSGVQEPMDHDVSDPITASLTILTPVVPWKSLSETLLSIPKNRIRLNFLEGDYFYPYNRELALQAEKVRRIGDGGSGTVIHVYAGTRAQRLKNRDPSVLSVKFIRIIGNVRKSDLDNEIRAIDKLCTLDNGKNLVQVFHHESGPADSLSSWHDLHEIDMELCTKNLRDEIKSDSTSMLEQLTQVADSISNTEHNSGLEDRLQITCTKILGILFDILHGLEFIHIHDEVHRDLKPENILFSYIDRRWKIADFGATTEGTSQGPSHTTSRRGTERYRAPELLGDEGLFTSKTDIWAFGCITYEICTAKQAFSGDWATMKYVDSGGEPHKSIFEFPSGRTFEKRAKSISDTCVTAALQLSMDARPSAADILKVLKEIK